jgi:hypothetical protein
MRTIYIDSENKCHTVNDGTMTAVETDFFDGKCDTYIEGFCYEIRENSTAIYAWKDYAELDTAQREYERALIADMQNALDKLGVTLDA